MINKLLEYQTVDAELREIEVSLKQSEERKKASQAKNFLNTVNESIAKLEQKAEELVSRFNSAVKLHEKLSEEASEYEGFEDMDEEQLSYVKKKALSLAEEINNLSNSISQISKEIESVLKEFTQVKTDMKKAKAQYAEYAPKYNELKASKKGEIEAIEAKLAKIEKDIPADVMEKYKQRRKDKIFPVLNEAKEMSKNVYCRCGTQLPVTSYNNLKNGNVVECDSCHRLLYLK